MAPKIRLPIIAFAPHPWDEHQWMNRQHLLSRLGERGWPVIYNTGALSLWQRNTSTWQASPTTDKFISMDNVQIHLGGKLLPRWPSHGLLEKLSIWNYSRLINKFAGIHNRKSISLLFHPSFLPYAQSLKSEFLAMHVYDVYSGMPNWNRDLENKLSYIVDKANLITAATESMAESLPGKGPKKTKILHNGVDPTPFMKNEEYSCPADLAEIPYPRIANLGTINLKMDMLTIAKIAMEKPAWNWVFVGRLEEAELNTDSEAKEGLALCKQLSNVHFLGEKSRLDIPAYAHNVDVNTVCYRIRPDDWVISGYPLKLNEYLAVGKPVVASPQTAICKYFSDVVDIAYNYDNWLTALEHAISQGGVSTPERRKEVAMSNTWDKRVDLLEKWLFEMTENK